MLTVEPKSKRSYTKRLKQHIHAKGDRLPTLGAVTDAGFVEQGYMEKAGGMTGSTWERRFFVLSTAGTLYWFKEHRLQEEARILHVTWHMHCAIEVT